MKLFPAGGFRRLLVLGLDRRAVNLCSLARKTGIDVAVVAGPRQLDETLSDGQSAAKAVKNINVDLIVRDSLTPDDPVLVGSGDTLVFSTSSPFIIRSWLIERFGGRVVNSHGTRLPEWRGGGGFSWQIMAGDRSGNSLVHLVTPGIDDGTVVFERSYVFPSESRRPIDYINHAEKMDRDFVCDFVTKVSEGFSFPLRAQDENISTYFPRLNSERQGFIDWSWRGDAIERFILAFSTPYPGAKTLLRNKEVHIFDAHFLAGARPQHPFFVGLVVRLFSQRLHVIAEGGQLEIKLTDTLGLEQIKVGDRLHTPRRFLEEAMALRPVYTATGLKV
jgi:methionyl-tRNA formyltransferase